MRTSSFGKPLVSQADLYKRYANVIFESNDVTLFVFE